MRWCHWTRKRRAIGCGCAGALQRQRVLAREKAALFQRNALTAVGITHDLHGGRRARRVALQHVCAELIQHQAQRMISSPVQLRRTGTIQRLGTDSPIGAALHTHKAQRWLAAVRYDDAGPLDGKRRAVDQPRIGTERSLRADVVRHDMVADQDAVVIGPRRQRQGHGLPALAIAAAAIVEKRQAGTSKAIPAADHLCGFHLRAGQRPRHPLGIGQIGASQGALGSKPHAQLTAVVGNLWSSGRRGTGHKSDQQQQRPFTRYTGPRRSRGCAGGVHR